MLHKISEWDKLKEDKIYLKMFEPHYQSLLINRFTFENWSTNNLSLLTVYARKISFKQTGMVQAMRLSL